MPPARNQATYQKLLLEKITEVGGKVDESLRLGRENGEELRSLRKELGLEGNHGRLPILEQAQARLDRQQEEDNKRVNERIDRMKDCIEKLENSEHEAHGKRQIVTILISVLTSSGFVAFLAYLAKTTGMIH